MHPEHWMILVPHLKCHAAMPASVDDNTVPPTCNGCPCHRLHRLGAASDAVKHHQCGSGSAAVGASATGTVGACATATRVCVAGRQDEVHGDEFAVWQAHQVTAVCQWWRRPLVQQDVPANQATTTATNREHKHTHETDDVSLSTHTRMTSNQSMQSLLNKQHPTTTTGKKQGPQGTMDVGGGGWIGGGARFV